MPEELGRLPETTRSTQFAAPIQTNRGWTNLGLRLRALAVWTFQVTGGTSSPGVNTFNLTVAGASILGGTVDWTTSHNATALLISIAVNANSGSTGLMATNTTDTVTIRQITGGALTITKVVAGDAAGTLAQSTAGTDTWTAFVSGATFDGDLYYQLGWSGALVTEAGSLGTDMTNARLTSIDLYCDGQAFQLWSGGLRATATTNAAIIQGISTATATWLRDLPWFNTDIPLIIKVAADEELLYIAKFV
jgi:hypothetical protein